MHDKSKLMSIIICILVTFVVFLTGGSYGKYKQTVTLEPMSLEINSGKFVVSFDTQADDVTNPSSIEVFCNRPYGTLPTIERIGYTFSGWTQSATGKDYVNSTTIVKTTSNHTLYAQWDAKVYTVRFHPNGASGTMEDQVATYDGMFTLRENSFVKDGDYKFGGWSLEPNGPIKYINKQEVVNLLEGGVLDLYAVWIQNSYTLTFDYNGGSGEAVSKQVLYGEPYGVLPTYPTKEESLFDGWYTHANGGTRVRPSTLVELKEDHTLYAHWIPSPANDIIQDLVVKNNPDDNNDGVADATYLTFKCSSYFEKFNIPIEGLVPGQRYKLTYTASNNASFGDIESGYSNARYGSYIMDVATEDKGNINEAFATDIIAVWNDRSKGDEWLNGPHVDRTMTFTANKSTMYWVWEFGLMQDGPIYEYNIMNITLEPVVPEIRFDQKQLVIPTASAAQIVNQTNGVYNTTFEFDGDGGCETLYYSITGLSAGSTYTITFDHTFTGALIGGTSYDYGCGIMNSKPTKYTGKMNDLGTWSSNQFVHSSVTNTTESVTLTFTATSDTAYWVWNLANVSDSTNCNITVDVTNFSAVHSGGSVVYYSK